MPLFPIGDLLMKSQNTKIAAKTCCMLPWMQKVNRRKGFTGAAKSYEHNRAPITSRSNRKIHLQAPVARCSVLGTYYAVSIGGTPIMVCSPKAGPTLSAFFEGVWDGKTLPLTSLLPRCMTCMASDSPLNLNDPTCHTSIGSCSGKS